MLIDKMSFGERLKYVRKIKKLTQKQLEDEGGFGQTVIFKFESGSRKPSFDNLIKISDILEVSIDYLIGKTQKINVYTKQKKIFNDYEKLNDNDKELAGELIAMLAKRKNNNKMLE